MDLTGRLCAAKRVALAAGEKLLTSGDRQVESKGLHDFVTQMDTDTEKFIRAELLGEFPSDGFFGEETGGDESASGRWIVDPIDGTTNFIHRVPHYSISIAYEYENELMLGLVYAPALGELYAAEKGKGATLNDRPIAVSEIEKPAEALIGMSFAHRHENSAERMRALLSPLSAQVSDFRRFGSAALDLCYVACGRIDAFIELNLHLYDIAAGLLIVREAGGIATGWPGEAICEQTGNVLAANPMIHEFLTCFLAEY